MDDDAAPDLAHARILARVEFRELLRQRRMVRSYEPDPVDPSVIERVVATVRRAPSAGHSQGQRLLVVTEQATRDRIAELFGESERVAEGFEPWLARAPAHIFVCTREQDYHDRYRREDKLVNGGEIEWPVPYWHVDAGAALMLVLLAALDEGLASGVYGVPVELMQTVKELLEIPAEIAVVAGVTIGKPAPDPKWSGTSSRTTQRRRGLQEIVFWERWGGRR